MPNDAYVLAQFWALRPLGFSIAEARDRRIFEFLVDIMRPAVIIAHAR